MIIDFEALRKAAEQHERSQATKDVSHLRSYYLDAPRQYGNRHHIRKGSVVALGMRDGSCPVGVVEGVEDEWATLTLYDWLVGSFCGDERDVFLPDVIVALRGTVMSRDEKEEDGHDPDRKVIWMDPLGAFQTAWTAAVKA